MTKCEVVSRSLDMEIISDIKKEESETSLICKQEAIANNDVKMEPGITLKPKQATVTKSAAQIVHEQHGK